MIFDEGRIRRLGSFTMKCFFRVVSKRPPNPYLTGVIGWGFSMQFPQEIGNGTAAEQS